MLTSKLKDMKKFSKGGQFPDDAVREALTVCANKSDVQDYLAEYMARHHTLFATVAGEGNAV